MIYPAELTALNFYSSKSGVGGFVTRKADDPEITEARPRGLRPALRTESSEEPHLIAPVGVFSHQEKPGFSCHLLGYTLHVPISDAIEEIRQSNALRRTAIHQFGGEKDVPQFRIPQRREIGSFHKPAYEQNRRAARFLL